MSIHLTRSSTRAWTSLHIFTPMSLDRLLCEGVHPALVEADGQVAEWFFLRYWQGGSHVRLRVTDVGPDETDLADEQRLQRLQVSLERYLGANSYGGWTSANAYSAYAARLAEAEGLLVYERCLAPANSIQRRSYEPEHDRYGYGADLLAFERHFCDSSLMAMQRLQALRGNDPAIAITGLLAITSAWLAAAEPAVVLASHEALFEEWVGRDLRPDRLGDKEIQDRAEALEAVIGTRLDALLDDTPAGLDGWLQHWQRSLQELLAALLDHGTFDPSHRGSWLEMHRPRLAPLLPSLDLCAHLFCNRLGISPPQEGLIRVLAYAVLQRRTRTAGLATVPSSLEKR